MNVPTLDLSKFISGIDEERKAFSDDLGHSFNQTGFAIIKNHGLKKELTDELYKVIKAFFDLEDEKKIKYYFPDLYGQRGYVCLLYTSPSPRDNTTSRMPSSA